MLHFSSVQDWLVAAFIEGPITARRANQHQPATFELLPNADDHTSLGARIITMMRPKEQQNGVAEQLR